MAEGTAPAAPDSDPQRSGAILRVAIVGAGPVGLATLLTAKLYSPGSVVMLDVDPARLQTARALAAAHAVNIIHRDLKPENIMLVQRAGQPDFVKVLDFGIAKVLGAGASGAFTAIGSVVGTPQYMAPEQASAGVVDTRSDIYSLGLIFHELIRGRPTFTGDSAVELMSRQLDTPPPPLRSPWGTVPAPLERIIMQMLEKVPDQRPASMEAVIALIVPRNI
jgi:serine/threonine-protein kinase